MRKQAVVRRQDADLASLYADVHISFQLERDDFNSLQIPHGKFIHFMFIPARSAYEVSYVDDATLRLMRVHFTEEDLETHAAMLPFQDEDDLRNVSVAPLRTSNRICSWLRM